MDDVGRERRVDVAGRVRRFLRARAYPVVETPEMVNRALLTLRGALLVATAVVQRDVPRRRRVVHRILVALALIRHRDTHAVARGDD